MQYFSKPYKIFRHYGIFHSRGHLQKINSWLQFSWRTTCKCFYIVYKIYSILYGHYAILYDPYAILYGPNAILYDPYAILSGPYAIFGARQCIMHLLSSLVLTDSTTTSGSITVNKSTKQLSSVNGHITSLMEFQFVLILENRTISFNFIRDQTEMIFLQIPILL